MEKSMLTGVTRSNQRVLRGSIIADEEMDATLKSEVFFNTTDGSSGRPLMSDEPNESGEKSVLLAEVTRSNKRVSRGSRYIKTVLRGCIIADEEMDALKSEVFFNTTDGNPSGLRETSFPVPPASKKWKNKECTNSEWWRRLRSGPRYSFDVVVEMTHNFEKRIEEYAFGTMYHGKLYTGQEVAVKVWEQRSHSPAKEFDEFEKVCGVYEKYCEHLVKMIGYCEDLIRRISIYEHMPGGTL
ncbi:hypothetical protein CY35_08G114200 [Sphagnum magellanicum]|nr:hypothetical protein CY35_08G114200 [Sphagnum magellanicum]